MVYAAFYAPVKSLEIGGVRDKPFPRKRSVDYEQTPKGSSPGAANQLPPPVQPPLRPLPYVGCVCDTTAFLLVRHFLPVPVRSA